MESFYGGRKGDSMIIVKSFDSEEQMHNFFQDKNDKHLSEVGYGQYVIIDTIKNKKSYNDPTNGKVYRRGFEEAEYIAQIVGPQGGTPALTFGDYTKIIEGDEEYQQGIISAGNLDLVPGYNEETGEFLDSIKYVWVNLKDEHGRIIGVKLGFRIPYTIFNFDIKNSLAYYAKPLAERQQNSGVFYESWILSLPKGIPGNSIDETSFKVITDAEDGKTYLKYDIKEYDIDYGNRTKEYYRLLPVKIPFNTVESLVLDKDGTLHFNYTYNEDTIAESKLQWVESMEIDEVDQKLYVKYNTQSEGERTAVSDEPINYIKDMVLTDEAHNKPFHLYVYYADPAKRGSETYKGESVWTDLGYVRGEAGGLRIIGTLPSISNLKNAAGGWLKPEEVEGWSADGQRAGWGYQIGEDIYVYDYVANTPTWYSIGKLLAASNNFIVISDNEAQAETLYNEGVWLIMENSKSME